MNSNEAEAYEEALRALIGPEFIHEPPSVMIDYKHYPGQPHKVRVKFYAKSPTSGIERPIEFITECDIELSNFKVHAFDHKDYV